MINVEAILQHHSPAKDRSQKFYFQTTKEGSEQLAKELHRKFLKVCRVVCVSDDDFEDPEEVANNEPPPTPKPEEGKKSPSQRLKAAIYKVWEVAGWAGADHEYKNFENYYNNIIEGYIYEIKRGGLEPPLPEERG